MDVHPKSKVGVGVARGSSHARAGPGQVPWAHGVMNGIQINQSTDYNYSISRSRQLHDIRWVRSHSEERRLKFGKTQPGHTLLDKLGADFARAETELMFKDI